jgi:hypothetical protein
MRRRTTCSVPGHGSSCEPSREKDTRYSRVTEEALARAFEEWAEESLELAELMFPANFFHDWNGAEDNIYDWPGLG